MSDRWEIEDTWASIWYALAVIYGGDPDVAVQRHRDYQRMLRRRIDEAQDDDR